MKIFSRRNFIIGGVALTACGAALSWPFIRRFGALPNHEFSSANYYGGEFHNLESLRVNAIPAGEPSYSGGWFKFFLDSSGDRVPPGPVKSERVNLHDLQDGEFVWLGHSSILLKLAGKFICIDPVLSEYASPVPFLVRAWPGSSPYSPEDFPEIDYLCISHDHWDHLDYPTLCALKFKNVICGQGVDAHFAYWGFQEPARLDWFDSTGEAGLKFIFTPSLHFSGRGTAINKSQWGGFFIDAGSGGKVFFSGDGGFGSHFALIGEKCGRPDIVFPDSGQYNRAWSGVHMFPEQAAQAALDMRAPLACPVHIGKFTLSWHPWNEPQERFAKAAKDRQPFVLPAIGSRNSIA